MCQVGFSSSTKDAEKLFFFYPETSQVHTSKNRLKAVEWFMKLITFLGDFSATWTGMADVESGHGMCWRTAGMSSGMELRVDMGATKKGWHVNCGLRQHPPLALIISGQWWKRPIPIRYLPHGGDHHPQVLGTSFDRLSTQHCVVHGWWQQCFDLGDRKPFNWLQLWSAAHFCLYSLFGCHRQNNFCLIQTIRCIGSQVFENLLGWCQWYYDPTAEVPE